MATYQHVLHETKGVRESFDLAARIDVMAYATLPAPIFNMDVNTQWAEIFNSTEGITGAKKLAEQETPIVVAENEGYQVTLQSERYGSGVIVTSTDMQKMRDGTIQVRPFLDRQRDDQLRDLRTLMARSFHQMINEGFSGTAEYLAPDGNALYGAHTYRTGRTFNNSGTIKMSLEAMESLDEYGGAFTNGVGDQDPQNFNVILVKKGSKTEQAAKRILNAEYMQYPDPVSNIDIFRGEKMIVSSPYLTDGDAWYAFALDDRRSPLYVGINQMPLMHEPIDLENQAMRMNVEAFWKQGINKLPVNAFASNGTTGSFD